MPDNGSGGGPYIALPWPAEGGRRSHTGPGGSSGAGATRRPALHV